MNRPRPPAFQFYVKDWLTSRKIAVMDLSQVGAYSFLLAACWDSDDCSLPDDDQTLAALSRMGEQWATDASAPVRACFIPHPNHAGHLTNKRLFAEFKLLEKHRRDKRRAGHIGGVKSGLSRRQIRVNDGEAELKHTFDSASSKPEAKRTSSSSSSSSSSLMRDKEKEPPSLSSDLRPTRKPKIKSNPVLIPMPTAFTISDSVWNWTSKQKIPRETVEREFETFCNDRLSKGVQYADWDRAFMTWLGRKGEFAQPRRNGHMPSSPQLRKEYIPL